MALVSQKNEHEQQEELRRIAEKNQQLYAAHESVDQARMAKDHVYAMLFATNHDWRLGHYTSMANQLLESLHIQPGDPRSFVAQAVALLFNIGHCSLDSTEPCPPPAAPPAPTPELTAQEEEIIHCWNDLAPAIIMYLRGTKDDPVSASSDEWRKRIKTAQDAFLFFNMHLSPWFVEWLCADPQNRSAPAVLNRVLVMQFIKGALRNKIQTLINGVISSIEHFVAECINEYICIVGVYNPADERAQLHDYHPVPRLQHHHE